jgi:four helix bundle protein
MNNEEKDKIKTFTDLKAWQQSHKLVVMIYKVSEDFPNKETFGLTSQMRRAVVSITSNIAEGFSRQSYSDKIRFYHIAQGSNTELQNQLLVAKDVGYLVSEKFEEIAEQSVTAHKLINGLIKKSKTIRDS